MDKNLVDIVGNTLDNGFSLVSMGVAFFMAVAVILFIFCLLKIKQIKDQAGNQPANYSQPLLGMAIAVLVGISTLIYAAAQNTVVDGAARSQSESKFDSSKFSR